MAGVKGQRSSVNRSVAEKAKNSVGDGVGIADGQENCILVRAEKLMIGRGIAQNHGLVHCAVDIGLARNGAGRFGNGGAEMSGNA